MLDDVTDYAEIRDYLPREPRFRTLCTTRLQALSLGFERLPLAVLSEAAALDLLRSLAEPERIDAEPEAAAALCDWLGYLPLGLELVGQYLHQRRSLSVAKMLERLQNKRLEQQALRGAAYETTAQKGVRDAFELTWQELTPAAQSVACALSAFALAPIPWPLVEMSLNDWDEENLEDVRDSALVRQSLVQLTEEGFYQLHQLVREFLCEKLATHPEAESLKRGVGTAMVQTASQMPPTPTLERIATFTPLIPHWQETTRSLTDFLDDDGLTWPFIALGRFYEGQGLYAAAEPWWVDGLATARQRFGDDHPEVATTLNNLAGLYLVQGKYDQAEPLFLQALAMRRKVLGDDHPKVATIVNNLAGLYRAQGKYDQAEPRFLQALEILRKALGDDHPEVATTLNNLAGLYRAQGKYDQAEPRFLQALEISRKALGDDHPNVATSLNDLAGLYRAQGKYEQAESLFLQALDIWRKSLGDDHPDVATGLNNLVNLYYEQGKYEQAESLFLQALDIWRKSLGDDHPDVATGLNNLAGFCLVQGKYEQAEPLYLQALEISRKALGEDHPSVATTLNNLAGLYKAQGKYEQAEPLYLAALPILFSRLGQNHPNSQGGFKNFVGCLRQAQQAGRADTLSDHPLTQDLLRQIRASG